MRNDQPLVSVVMTCYNHEKYVGEAIESVLNQTYKNIEFIIVDNGSTDNSYEVIQQYKDRISKIVHSDENKRMYWGFYFAQEAKGQYIATMTSDDYWEKDKLELQMQILINNPDIKACTTWAVQTDENLRIIPNKRKNIFEVANRTRYEWFRHFILNGNCLAWPTGVIEARTYERINNKLRAYKQLTDMYFWAYLVQESELYVVPKELAKFRWHEKGNNKNESAITPESYVRLMNETVDIADNLLESVDDVFFKKAFQNELIYPDSETHKEILCEKCFLLKRMAEKNSIYQPVAIKYFYKYFMVCREVFEEKYHFTYPALHDWCATVGVAKSRLDYESLTKNIIQQVNQKEQMLQGMKQLFLEGVSDNLDKGCIKHFLFKILPKEKQELIGQIDDVTKKSIKYMNQIIGDSQSEIYFAVVELMTGMVQAIDAAWDDLKFVEFAVTTEDWKAFKELIGYASKEYIDLSEAVLPFAQYLGDELKDYFEN